MKNRFICAEEVAQELSVIEKSIIYEMDEIMKHPLDEA